MKFDIKVLNLGKENAQNWMNLVVTTFQKLALQYQTAALFSEPEDSSLVIESSEIPPNEEVTSSRLLKLLIISRLTSLK